MFILYFSLRFVAAPSPNPPEMTSQSFKYNKSSYMSVTPWLEITTGRGVSVAGWELMCQHVHTTSGDSIQWCHRAAVSSITWQVLLSDSTRVDNNPPPPNSDDSCCLNLRDPIAFVTRNSSVSIASRHGQNGRRIESRWGRDFLHQSRSILGPTQPPIQEVPGLFPREKRSGRGLNHPPHLALWLKKE